MVRSLLLLIVLILSSQCSKDNNYSGTESAYSSPQELYPGKALALQYCASCHLFPEPHLLDKKTWIKSVLPNMAARMGLRTDNYDPFEGVDPEQIASLKTLNIYPQQALLNEKEWQAIVNYYQDMAPESLPDQNSNTPVADVPAPFDVDLMEIGDKPVPQVTLLEFDDASGTLFVGDHLQVYAFDRNNQTVGNWEIKSPASDIELTKKGVMLLSIGEFNPSDKKEGVLFPLTLRGGGSAEDFVIAELPRPVQFATGDLNQDSREDVVICNFGNHQGKLAWYDQFDTEKEQLLSNLPGARKAVIQDMNGDGLNDIVVLMAQAWEKLAVYYNQGEGNFKESTLIEMPSVYGSSFFELVDFDADGHLDILLTNGDNWDYSQIRKPYHGLRIYLNDGNNNFSEEYFFPMYGCSEAKAVDFDKDGDLDIAAIAFYSDDASKGFVYLENRGQLNFNAYYLNETSCGKWLTMEAGDFNRDGYPEIYLGSYFHNAAELTKLMASGIEVFPELLLLTYQAESQ